MMSNSLYCSAKVVLHATCEDGRVLDARRRWDTGVKSAKVFKTDVICACNLRRNLIFNQFVVQACLVATLNMITREM